MPITPKAIFSLGDIAPFRPRTLAGTMVGRAKASEAFEVKETKARLASLIGFDIEIASLRCPKVSGLHRLSSLYSNLFL
jgi:hypothetical protein